MKTRRYLIAAAIFIASAIQTHAQNQSYEVTGALVNEDGAPIAQHRVLLYNDTNEEIAVDTTDAEGKFTLAYQVTTVSLNPNDNPDVPGDFKLGSSYPNPFNPRTTVPFYAPENTRAVITVYNILGQQMLRTQADFDAGSHEIQVNLGGRLSQGQYILRVQGDGFSLTQSMTYVSAGIGGGKPEIRVLQGGQTSNRIFGSMHQMDDDIMFRLVVEETDSFSGMELQVPANQNYDVDLLELARKVQKPQLTTMQATNITLTAARSGGTITDDGGSEITEMGVVWATSENPTITSSDGITADSLDDGLFNSRILGLLPETTYYVRAYATNSAGTSYGESFEFHTPTVEEIKDGVDEIVTRILSEDLLPVVKNEIENVPEEHRAEYLDSLNTALNRLENVLSEFYSIDEFKERFNSYFQSMSKDIIESLDGQSSLVCNENMRIAVATGLIVDLTARASITSNLAQEISSKNGGGVESIYDFVNMDRNVYHFQMCGYNKDIFIGLDLGATATLDIGGFYRVITNVPTNDFGNKKRFDGTIKGKSFSFKQNIYTKWGLDLGFSFGSAQQIGPFTFDNFSECPEEIPNIVTNNRGISEISLAVEKGSGFGLNISIVIKNEEFASSRKSIDYFYKDFNEGWGERRFIAATKMSFDMLSPSIADGFEIYINPLNSNLAFLPFVYVMFDPNDCPPPQFIPNVRTLESNLLTQNSAVISATIADDGDSPITERGICWSETNDPDSFTNCTSESTGMGEFSITIRGLQADKQYYARAFAGNSIGTAYGDRIGFTTLKDDNNGDWPRDTETEIVDVFNPATGKTWMDRNLGASRAATSSTDAQAYGDLYQWGRPADGHQIRNSPTISTLSSSDLPGHGSFILALDWRSPQNNNLWQGVNGINNPCPAGYRLPTDAEWEAERNSWSSNNASGAFASPLKVPVAGTRSYHSGSLFNVGGYGTYWSGTVSGSNALSLNFLSLPAGMVSYPRAIGFSVRCLRE